MTKSIKDHVSYTTVCDYMDRSIKERWRPFQGHGDLNSCESGILYEPVTGLKPIIHNDTWVCHGRMGTNLCGPYHTPRYKYTVQFVYSSLWLPDQFDDTLKASAAFFEFITDPKLSPWRALLQDNALEEFYVKGDNSDRVPAWFSLRVNKDSPSQLVMNFLIATRALHEHAGAVKSWYRLVLAGCDPYLALAMLYFIDDVSTIGKHGEVIVIPSVNGRGSHYFLNAPQIEKATLLRAGTSRYNASKTLGMGNGYTPCNSIWNSPTKHFISSEEVKEYLTKMYGFSSGVAEKVSVIKRKHFFKESKQLAAFFGLNKTSANEPYVLKFTKETNGKQAA